MRDPPTLALLTLAATLTLLPWVTGEVHVVCQSSWYGGFHGEVRFYINQTLTYWQVHIVFQVPVDHIETLDSNVQKISDYDFLVTPKSYDTELDPGVTLAISFNGFTPGAYLTPFICAYIVGFDAYWACPRDGITAPPTIIYATAAPLCQSLYCGPGHCVVQSWSMTAVCDCSNTGYTGDHCEIARDTSWGPWNAYTTCTVSCGGGTQVRTRGCTGSASQCRGDFVEYQSCNTQTCRSEHTTAQCPSSLPPTSNLFIHGSHCYDFITSRTKEFNDAEHECQQLRGHLVTIPDADTQQFIYNTFVNTLHFNGQVWIGMTDQEREGQHHWVDGSPVTYTHWGPGEPTGAASDCTVMMLGQGGMWYDRNCADSSNFMLSQPGHHYFVCQYAIPGQTTTTTTQVTTTVDPDAGWGPWGSWSACSQSCGGGTRSHSRFCRNPDPSQWAYTTCFGLSYEVQSCNTQACPTSTTTASTTTATTTTTPVTTTVDPDAGWGPWSSWTACSQSCGGGTRSSSRYCQSPDPSQWAYTTCLGISHAVQECHTQHCPTTTTISTTTASTTTTPVTIAVDPCLSLTCRPGHCVVHAGRAVCDCSGTGYTGTHCEINPCDSYDCGPGLCERHGTPSAYAVCDCSGTGFTGDHCQHQISIVGRASS